MNNPSFTSTATSNNSNNDDDVLEEEQAHQTDRKTTSKKRKTTSTTTTAKKTASTALLFLLSSGTCTDDDTLKEVLLEELATAPDKNIDNVLDNDGRTLLYWSTIQNNAKLVQILLNEPFNSNPNLTDDDGFFPLWIACKDGYYDIVKLLLEHGNANPNQCLPEDVGGTTSLFMSILEGHTNISKLLLEHPSINVNMIIEKTTKISPLQLAQDLKQFTIAKLLYEKYNAMNIVTCITCPPVSTSTTKPSGSRFSIAPPTPYLPEPVAKKRKIE